MLAPLFLIALLAGPDPADPYALDNAATEKAASDPAAAAVLWEQELALAPGNARVMYDLGLALAQARRPAEALPWLQRAATAGVSGELDALRKALGTRAAEPAFRKALETLEANGRHRGDSTVEAVLRERDLMPESLAVDPRDGALYVGSINKRKLVKLTPQGTSDFVTSGRDGLAAVLGIKLDPVRRQLVANSCTYKGAPSATPVEPGQEGIAWIHVFDLDSGRLVAKFHAGSAQQPVCFNDLVVAVEGDVYATAGPGGVWRLTRSSGVLEPWLTTPHEWYNGIALSADARTLYLAEHLRGVRAVDLATRRSELVSTPEGVSLAGIDGLYATSNSLVAVQNGLRPPARVVQAFLAEGGRAVRCLEVLEQENPLFDIPTTGAIVGERLVYVAASQLRAVTDGKMWGPERLKESPILSVRLRPGCGAPAVTADLEQARAELLAVHRRDREAHFGTSVAAILEHQGDGFLSVSNGKLDHSTRAEVASTFERYFAGARYFEWDDLEPPVVNVSNDASQGWVVTRLKVRRTQRQPDGTEKERAFVYAGIMTYTRQDGRWVRIANVSTFE